MQAKFQIPEEIASVKVQKESLKKHKMYGMIERKGHVSQSERKGEKWVSGHQATSG